MPDTHMLALPCRAPTGSDAVVLAEVTDIIRQVLEDRSIDLRPEMPIDALAGWDSMNHIAILVEAECRFDVEFALEDLEAVSTVGDLVRLIRAKRLPGDRAVH